MILLKDSSSHYALCHGLELICIVWSEPDPRSDSLFCFLVNLNSEDARDIEFKLDIEKGIYFEQQVQRNQGIEVDVVFYIDDDIIYSCAVVEFSFCARQSAPDTMGLFLVFIVITIWYLLSFHEKLLPIPKGSKDTSIYSG